MRTPRSGGLQLTALAAALAATLGHEGVGIHSRQYYSTDSGAFNQVAAHLAVHGVNPYTSTMAAAARLLQHPTDFWTYTVTGGHIDDGVLPGRLVPDGGAGHVARLPASDRGLDGPPGLAGHRGPDLRPAAEATALDRAPAGDRAHLRRRLQLRRAPTPPSCPSWCSPCGAGTGSAPAARPAWPGGWARWPSGWPAR